MTFKDCLIRDLLYLFLTTSLWIPYPVVVQVNLRLCAIGAFLGIFYAELTLGFFFFFSQRGGFYPANPVFSCCVETESPCVSHAYSCLF